MAGQHDPLLLLHAHLVSQPRPAGHSFKGSEEQYKWLARLAQEVFGSSLTARVVRSLVDAFIRVPGR